MSASSFEDWAVKFQRSREVKDVWNNIDSLKTYVTGESLKRRLVKACFLAATYDETTDPYSKRRETDKQFYNELDKHLADLERIETFITLHDVAPAHAFARAILELRENKKITISCEKKTETHTLLLQILESYKQALQKPLFGVRAGPFIHRTQIGNLIYPAAIDLQDRVVNPQISGLLFELTIYFRLATDKVRATQIIDAGCRMPSSGKPCTKLVKSLVNKTLHINLSEQQCRDRVKALVYNDAGLAPWPHH